MILPRCLRAENSGLLGRSSQQHCLAFIAARLRLHFRRRFTVARQAGTAAPKAFGVGTRGGGRTRNLRLRRPTLYPIELLAQGNGQHTCARNPAQMEFARESKKGRHRAVPVSMDVTPQVIFAARPREAECWREVGSQPAAGCHPEAGHFGVRVCPPGPSSATSQIAPA